MRQFPREAREDKSQQRTNFQVCQCTIFVSCSTDQNKSHSQAYVMREGTTAEGGSKLKHCCGHFCKQSIGFRLFKIKWSPILSTLFPLRGAVHIPQHWKWANLCLHGLKSVKVTLYDFPGSSGFFLVLSVCQYVPFWGTPSQNLASLPWEAQTTHGYT